MEGVLVAGGGACSGSGTVTRRTERAAPLVTHQVVRAVVVGHDKEHLAPFGRILKTEYLLPHLGRNDIQVH